MTSQSGSFMPSLLLNRREALQAGMAALASGLPPAAGAQSAPARRSKKVIVAGGGIGGLCCAYELMKRGHDVLLLEASGRTGGHVRTLHDPLPDGLYADVGAEHFTKPGYDQLWKYVEEFALPVLPYPRRDHQLQPIDGKWYSDEQLRDRNVLQSFGFNRREIEFLMKNDLTELSRLYFAPYFDAFADDYQPFDIGLDQLDQMTIGDLLAEAGASDAAFRFTGGERRGDGGQAARPSGTSALYRIWQSAIRKRRGVAEGHKELYRLRGGNQRVVDAFVAKLGERVRLGCPVTAIEHGPSGVTVHYIEYGAPQRHEAEYLVSALPMGKLKDIPVTPPWPEAKDFAIRNVVFSSQARVVFQCRTPFWKGDLPSANVSFGDGALNAIWESAEEVAGGHALLLGHAKPRATAAEAAAVLRQRYPGKHKPTIEQTLVHHWIDDPWSAWCERLPFPLGQMRKFWPHVMEPVGRIHFAGAHADNIPWGMDASTRSANRVAQAIDDA
ncbi:MAG TPA: NAD(P)/FAD-dependent oxidoreductase [Pirellulales bacterium]|nr:NAD(P)/FAD-dependent oxidoreductase [Pirellulales bacterium]